MAKKTAKKDRESQNIILLLSALAIVIALIFIVLRGDLINGSKKATPSSSRETTIALLEQNKSRQKGTATIKEVGKKVSVKIDLTGFPKAVSQPAHIHLGSCPTPSDIKYSLSNVVDGTSETTIDVSFDELVTAPDSPFSLNVHKSAKEVKVYVACGDL